MSADRDERRKKRVEAFRLLAGDRLQRLSVGWVEFERTRGDLTAFLREVHTLKGECSLVGFAAAAKVLHAVEDIAQRMRAGERPPTPEEGDLVISGLEVAGSLTRGDPTAPSPEAEGFLARVRHDPTAAREGGGPKAPTLSNTTPFPAASPPVEAAPAPELAGPAEPRPGTASLSGVTISAPRPPASAARPTAPAVAPEAPAPSLRNQSSVRVSSDKLDRLRDMVAETLLSRVRLRGSSVELRKARDAARGLQSRLARSDPEGGREAALVAEILAGLETRLRDESHTLARLAAELDVSTRDLRMVPLRTLLDRYPVPLRTLARSLGREVAFTVQGDEIDVDKGVLEALEEPLLHLLRNAVDHGIEDPASRKRIGKPGTATLALAAKLVGQMLHLEVSDDGSGIDVEAVRHRAVEMGLVDAAAAASLPEPQVLRTIFSAGLSTRKQVTEISGRGIGLNVVLDVIEALGGVVDITTKRNEGTTFHLRIPIAAAISRVMLFRVGSSRYALLASAVKAVVDGAEHPSIDSIDGPVVRYAGGLVPFVALDTLLGEAGSGVPERRILIAQSGGDLVALAGTRDHFDMEALVKPPGKIFERNRLVSAVVQPGDGSLALVLKASELIISARQRLSGAAAAAAAAPRQRPVATVLVVDDSPVVRDVIGETLRSYGLQVLEAGDGHEALQKLALEQRIDLLVTDVDMPRLDGLGLLRALRAMPQGQRLPAVVVSMRGAEPDRQAALDAGADAYLVKSEFSPASLWNLVSEVIARR
jgi:chemotaxis protein histidine kinase CheA